MADEIKVNIQGADMLKQLLKTVPENVERRAINTGLSKAGARLRTYFRRAAPKKSGKLFKALGVKRDRKTGHVSVGLMSRFYYKTLDFTTKRGPPLNPYFEKVWEQRKEEITQMVLNETLKALFVEAGKAYQKSIQAAKK
jgi:hypothetical protein